MDPATLLTLTQTILQVLDSSLIKEVGSLGSFESQVAKLKSTMSTVKAVLVDAEKQERQLAPRNNVERDWLAKLRDAVYQADDLFDKIATIAQRKRLKSGNKLTEVRVLFSCTNNQLVFSFNASREVKKIRERLNDISKDHHDFYSRPPVSGGGRIMTKRREDSHSFVYAEDVIGRDGDKKVVLDMLLDCSVQQAVHFVTIVGIGGLGKTTLAQLIFNDKRVVSEFQLRIWVCVSDEFDIREILCNILKTANQHLKVEELQHRVRKKIDGKRYLLVLDDVWNEDRNKWLKLRDLLIGGGRGSRVVVTSRSKLVAKIVDGSAYELEGLSPKHSWCLFEKMAFSNEEEQTDVELIEVGQSILKKCASVPLAIRVAGSLLYGQNKSVWLSFRNRDLINMKKDDEGGVLPMLKLSYHHLTMPLKSCFSYCALFPKEYIIEKEVLVNLWMAHGFLVPSEGQSVQAMAEEYFMILLQRCFFQEAKQDDFGETVACKLHGLMHDVAQEVVGRDILVVDSVSELKEKTRHLSFVKMELQSISSSYNEMENLRTFFKLGSSYCGITIGEINESLKKARYLRVLCLSQLRIRTLPASVEKLVHLRYLDLSCNLELEFLPATLCNLLNNLQTLKLTNCCCLKELPRNLSKLEKLRHLDIDGCDRLTHMPVGLGNLTCLEKLSEFIVTYTQKGGAHRGKLEEIEMLTNLEGSLKISVCNFTTFEVAEGVKYVKGMKNLKKFFVKISCPNETGSLLLLEALQPDCNLIHFHLSGHNGATFPNWDSQQDLGISLPNLVEFSLYNCKMLQHLPSLNRIHHLRSLDLSELDNLEYIENSGSSDVNCSTWVQSTSFPALKKLRLQNLPKLKEWRKTSSSSSLFLTPVPYLFPSLSDLIICHCPYMTSIPLVSNVENLIISFDNASAPSSSIMSSCCLTHSNELTLQFCNNENFESLSIVEELFRSHMSSICSLHIKGWWYLKSLCGAGLEHLTALQTLHLLELDKLEKLEDMPWKFLSRLCHLKLRYLPKLVKLPQGIQHLTALQSLCIEACDSFELSTDCVNYLTSLKHLYIYVCEGLTSLPPALFDLPSLIELETKNCEHLEEAHYQRTDTCWKPEPPKLQPKEEPKHKLEPEPEPEPEPELEPDRTEMDLPYNQSGSYFFQEEIEILQSEDDSS